MYAVFNIALPFFALIFTGYAAGRSRVLPASAVGGLNAFVFYFALPALLVVKVAEAPVEALFDGRLILAYYGAGLPLFAATFFVGRWLFPARPAVQALRSLAATFSNVGFVGLPLVITAFGADAALPAVVVLVVDTVVMIGLTVAIIEADLGRGGGWRRVARTVGLGLVRNPLIIASVAGALLGFLKVAIPGPLAAYGNLLGSAAGPCALFALGATLSGRPVRQGAAETGYMSALKLLIHPLLVWCAAAYVVDLPPLWVAVLVVEASLPIAANVYVLAQRYGVYAEQASTAILISTVIAIFTVSAVLSHFYTG